MRMITLKASEMVTSDDSNLTIWIKKLLKASSRTWLSQEIDKLMNILKNVEVEGNHKSEYINIHI